MTFSAGAFRVPDFFSPLKGYDEPEILPSQLSHLVPSVLTPDRPPTNDGLSLADDWAGPVAGPTMIERHFGIPRSTLYRWQKRKEVVWLNTRTSKKPVFPLRQFVDGRPQDGIADVVQMFGDPRDAWQWLLKPNGFFDETPPIEKLIEGNAILVLQALKSERR